MRFKNRLKFGVANTQILPSDGAFFGVATQADFPLFMRYPGPFNPQVRVESYDRFWGCFKAKNGPQAEPVFRRVLVEELLLADNLKGDLCNHIAVQTNGSGVLSGRTNWRGEFNLLLVKLTNTGSCNSSNDVSGLYGTE